MTRPLGNLLVVSLEQAVAAPLCSARLADAGARVVKVERPEGDFARRYDGVVGGESAYFVWLNRGKESAAVDIKTPEGSRFLHGLISKADVFIQNLAPGSAARAGFGSADLRAKYERLITCDITGYGDEGPAKHMKAYDLLIQCETGLAAITGSPSEAGRVGVSVADIACGMNAYAGVLEALALRSATGVGSGISVSLFDAIAEWMTVPLLQYECTGEAPERVGLNHPSIAPYGAYPTGGGERVVIAIQNDREWIRFCEQVLGLHGLVADERFRTNPLRCSNKGALDQVIVACFERLSRSVVVDRLRNARIAYASVNSVQDLAEHPQLRRVQVQTPAGPVEMPAAAVRRTGVSAPAGRVPFLNEHGPALKAEFGRSGAADEEPLPDLPTASDAPACSPAGAARQGS